MKALLTAAVIFLSAACCAQTLELSDSATVSLITCAPHDATAYTVYGHTALRVKDDFSGVDAVFNYGIFDFSSPGFLYRFARGDTYYILGVSSFRDFFDEYARRGSEVTEQILNLNADEKRRTVDALIVNSRPENRTYLYNFFYDNCSTRPRLLLESCVSGKIEYPEVLEPATLRTVVHHCNRNHPWLNFGIDLALGAPLDDSASQDVLLFLPENLMRAAAVAVLTTPSGESRPLVKETRTLVKSRPSFVVPSRFDPTTVSRLMLALVLIVSFWEFKSKKYFAAIDITWMLLYGLAGCAIVFLSFFSIHPAVFPNYSGIWANPLHVAAAFATAIRGKRIRKAMYYYMCINGLLMIFLLIARNALLGEASSAFLSLTLISCVRSLVYKLRITNYELRPTAAVPPKSAVIRNS
jgi:hypothetical protein